MTEPPSGDQLWDAWQAACGERPGLTPEEFSERFGPERDEVLGSLELLLQLADAEPSSARIELETGGRFGRFRLLRVLGQGSSGIVYLASEGEDEDASGQRVFAVKVMNPLLAVGERQRNQLLREARIAEELRHEGIVAVHDSGVDRGYAWIAMEHVEGASLASILGRDSRALRGEAVAIALQVARTLEYAHGRGVLHRDLKPANLVRTPEGHIKLLDFGLAHVEGAAFGISHTGEALGTPLYMAPEQLRGERRLGPPVDLYSLGLILLELASGRRLSAGGEHLHSLARIASGRHRLPRALLTAVPRPVADIVSRCTEPAAEDRYPDASTLALDLEAVGLGNAPELGRLGTMARWWRSARRQPYVIARRALVCALIAGSVLLAIGRWRDRPVRVRITTVVEGLQILGDGFDVTTPGEVMLAPGEYDYALRQTAPRSHEFAGTFLVERGRPNYVHLAHSCFPRSSTRSLEGVDYANDDWSWLQVAVKEKNVRLILRTMPSKETLFDDDVPGVFALRVPGGDYEVELSAQGRETIGRAVRVRADRRLVALSHELEPSGRRSRHLVVYSPLDDIIDALELDNARPHTGRSKQDTYTELPATKALFAPIDESRASEVRFRVALPLEDGEDLGWLQLQVTSNPEFRDGEWLKLELGPSFEEMVMMYGPELPDFGERDHDGLDAQLSESMQGARILCVRYRFGGCKSTLAEVQGAALRTNALPRLVEEEQIVWDPALTLRVWPRGATVPRRGTGDGDRELPDDPTEVRLVDREGMTLDAPSILFARYVPAASPAGHAYIAMSGTPDDAERIDVLFDDDDMPRTSFSSGRVGDGFGTSLTAIGDRDGDGTQELAVGAHQYDLLDGAGRGYVSIHDVQRHSVVELDRVKGQWMGSGFGTHTAPLDSDGDRTADELVVVGVGRYRGGWGSAYRVRLPANGSATREPFALGWNQADHFGSDVAILPARIDVGARVLVGAYNADPRGLDSGAVYVYDASTAFELHTFEGDGIMEVLGKSVSTLDLDGDGNGNGRRELILLGDRALRVHEDEPGYPLRWRTVLPPKGRYQRPLPFERNGETGLLITGRNLGASLAFDASGRCIARFEFVPTTFETVTWGGEERVLVGAHLASSGNLEPVFLADW